MPKTSNLKNGSTKIKGFKQKLPTKICLCCNRPFQYRKKWKDDWSEVKYCSQKCKLATKLK